MLLGGIAVLSCVICILVCLGAGAFSGLTWLWMAPLCFVGAFLLGLALSFLFLWLACALVDPRKEQQEDDPFYRFVASIYIEALIMLLGVRVRTEGLEKLPASGRFLLVCNHLFLADPGILLHVFRKSQLAFISKKENKDMFVVGKIMHRLLCQLIDRENDRAALKTILKCIQIIREDKASIAVFPEGYISKNHKLHHFRSGVFKIAQKAKVPVVVCTLTNTHRILENAARLKPTRVDVHVVAVLEPEDFAGETAVELGSRVYGLMAADLGSSD